MEIKNFVEELLQLKKDSETLQEIKRIMHNDGTIGIIEQITHLQNNTKVNNINRLQESLDKIEDKIESVSSEFSEAYDDAQNAIDNLNNISDYSDYADDAIQAVRDLQTDLDELTEDNTEQE
tara:strand:+ start:333 stop:698 length:366 start_codon:yes stop_codon:yes gene_type:complete